MNQFEGAEIPVSAFAGDQGECPPTVASALLAAATLIIVKWQMP